MPWNSDPKQPAIFMIDTGLSVPSPVNIPGTYSARARVMAGVVYGNAPGAGQYSHDYRCEATCIVSEPSFMHGAPANLGSDPLGRGPSSQLFGVSMGRLFVVVRVYAVNVADSIVSLRPDQIEWRVDRLT